MNAQSYEQFEKMAENAASILEDERVAHGLYVLEGTDRKAIMKRIGAACEIKNCCSQCMAWGIGATNQLTVLGGIDYHANFSGKEQREEVLEFVRRHLPDGEDVAVERHDRPRMSDLLQPVYDEAIALEGEFRAQWEVAS